MKKLFISIFTAVFALFALGTSTFAWFSMNREATATGMKVKVLSDASLIISSEAPTRDTTTYTVAFTGDAHELATSTHDSNFSTYTTGLKTIDLATKRAVDAATGLAENYNYAVAQNQNNLSYYYDYVIYLSVAGAEPLTGQDIKVSIDSHSVTLTNPANGDTVEATSIDFYVQTITAANADLVLSDSTFKGTLNIAGLDAEANDASTELEELVLLENGTIPLNSAGNSYLRVTMRVYVDGALLKDAGQAYVYSNNVTVDELTMSVKFVAADHQ